MIDLLTVGEALVSLRTESISSGWTATGHVAGAEANVAIGLARLGHASRWVGRVSADRLGEWIVATLDAEGVDTSFVVRDPDRPAGAMVLESPADHARRATYLRRASAGSALTAADVLPALRDCRRVHLTGVTLALSDSARQAGIELARTAASRSIPVSLDVNYRAALWTESEARAGLAEVLPAVTTVVASEDELPLVADGSESEAISALLTHGAAEVVIKRGERGAGIYWGDGSAELPAAAVPVVDVIGAGDALCTGLLSGLLDGLARPAALARGIDVAGACVASTGDWEGLPMTPHRS